MEYKQSSNFLKSALMTALAFTILSSPFALSNYSLSMEKAKIDFKNRVVEKNDKSYDDMYELGKNNIDNQYCIDFEKEVDYEENNDNNDIA